MTNQEDCDTVQAQQEEEQLEEEAERIEQEIDLEEEPPEFDIDEVAPELVVDELLAEYEMHAHELEEYLPSDTMFILEEAEIEAEDFGEDNDDHSVDTISIDQDMLVLVAKVEVQEIEEEELETYELIDTEQEIQEEGLESVDKQEENISIENDIWEEIEEEIQILEEDQEIEFSNINEAIEELTAEEEVTELELLQLEKELESIEEELITEQVKETEDEEIQELEENSNVGDTDWEYEVSEEQDYYDQETLDNDSSNSTSVEATGHEETNFDQEFEEITVKELEYQTEKDDIEEIEELEEIFESDEIGEKPETVEVTNNVQSVECEAELQSQQSIIPSEENYSLSDMNIIENTSIQPSMDIPTSKSIEIANSDKVPKQQSFGLSFDSDNLHNFSLNLLDTEVSALEKMLEEVESLRLLTQSHPKIGENVTQLLDIEFNQIPEITHSTNLVSQGPALPEPPPYDFHAELEEWENESVEYACSVDGQLIRTYEEAERTQLAASFKLNSLNSSLDPRLSVKKKNNETVKGTESINNRESKISPHLTLKSFEKRIIELGKIITLKSSYKEIEQYIDLWNVYVKKGGKIAQQLKNNFDLVAANTNHNKLARIKLFRHSEWMLKSCSGIESARKHINKWIPNTFLQEKGENKITKCRTGTILEWLKCRDKISINDKSVGEGAHKIYQKKSFYEIKIQGNEGQSKTLFIPNKKTSWNPNGFQSDNYSPSRKRKSQGAIAHELLEPISFHSHTTLEKRQIFREMQRIFPQLMKATTIPSRYIIYRPLKDLELDIFDDLLVTEFYKLYTSRGSILFQRASDYTQELIENQLKPVIKYITTHTFAETKGNYFKETITKKGRTITTKSRSRKHSVASSRTLKEKKFNIKWIIKENKEAPMKDRAYQDNTTVKSIKEEIILLGESISSDTDQSLINSYIKAWNNHVKHAGIVDTELKMNFDAILNKIGKDRLVRVKFHNKYGWFLESYTDVRLSQNKVNIWIPNAFPKEETINYSSRARISVVLEWLKCRDRIKILGEYVGKGSNKIYQKKSFFEIEVQADGGQSQMFFIPNKVTTWNLDGFKSRYFSPSNYGRSQSTIVHDLLDSVFFHSLSTNEKYQIFQTMKEIFPQLKKATQIGNSFKIYKPQSNLNLNVFDNLLMSKVYIMYASRTLSEYENASIYIQELMINQPKPLIKLITTQSFSSAEGNFFNIAIVDRKKAINLFKEKLKCQFKIDDISKNFQRFRERVRELGLRRISMIYEKARLEVAENVPSIHFTIENALEEGFEITDDYTNFWNEDHIDSFTGVAAGMMQNKDFRIRVLSKFKHLTSDNEKETITNSDITGKHIVPGGSISPDITVKEDGEIVEEVEVKQLRPIGRSIKDKTDPTMYWFDFFKTLETRGDPINHFSFHFVNKQDDVESMGWDCAKNGIGGVIVEAGEIKGIPKRLNEIITAFSYERWPSAHRIDKIPKIENRDIVMGIMERLETSAERKDYLKKVITEGEVEEFVRDVHVFPKDYKEHRGYVEILVYVLRKLFE